MRRFNDFDPLARIRLEVEGANTGLTNLVPNPTGDLGAWGWVTPVATSNLLAYPTDWNGNLGSTLRYRSPSPAAASYLYTEPMAITPGQYAGAKWDVPSIDGYYRASFEWLNGAYTRLSSTPQTAYTQVGTATLAAQLAPAGAAFVRLRFDHYSNTSGSNPFAGNSLELRNVTVAKAATAGALGVNRTNINANPSFEADVSGYVTSNGVTIIRSTAQAAVGTASMRMTCPTGGGHVITSGAVVTPGKDYTFQFRSRAATTPRPPFIAIEWFDALGESLYRVERYAVPNTTTGWTTTVLTATAPGNADSARIFMGVADSTAGEQHYFDALVLEQASTALAFITGAVTNQYLGVIATGYVNVLGPTHTIAIKREGLSVGTLTASIVDTSLHPAAASTIRPGRRCRLMVLCSDDIWRAAYTGKILDADVDYDLTSKDPTRIARISITATDNTTPLANAQRPEGVATVAALPYALEGCGVPWSINGSGNQVPTAIVVSRNDNATALDQIAITRDSTLATAWVDRDGVLVAKDAGVPNSPLIGGNWQGTNLRDARGYGGGANPTSTNSTGFPSHSAGGSGRVTANSGTVFMGFRLDRAAVVPGQLYRFTGWVRAVSTSRQTGRIIAWYDAAGVLIGQTSVTNDPAQSQSVSTEWRTVTFDATAPAGARAASPGVHVASPAVGEQHYFDDLTFYPILDEDTYNPDIKVSYSTKDLINEVTITSIEWDPADPTRSIEVPYGPYRDETSIKEWGRYSAEFTVHGLSSAQIATLGVAVLARNAIPAVRVESVTLPISRTDDLSSRALLDLYSLVRVNNTIAGVAADALVTGIEHKIDADGWLLTLTFTDTTSVASPQSTPSVQSNGVTSAGTFSPSPSADSGSYANASGSGVYTHVDGVVTFTYQANIVAAGTAGGALKFQVPIAAAGPVAWIMPGREVQVTGAILQAILGGTTVSVLTSGNASPIASGRTIVVSGTYKSA